MKFREIDLPDDGLRFIDSGVIRGENQNFEHISFQNPMLIANVIAEKYFRAQVLKTNIRDNSVDILL